MGARFKVLVLTWQATDIGPGDAMRFDGCCVSLKGPNFLQRTCLVTSRSETMVTQQAGIYPMTAVACTP